MGSLGIGKIARRLLRKRGQQICSITSHEQVREFIAMLRPMATNFPLVRIGGDGDGGYLVPDCLDGIEACFSPGVAATASFEEALALRGIRCYLADNSVDGPPVQNPEFHFEKKHLGLTEDATHTTLENWVERNGPFHSDLILQMDIEGGEYNVILDTSNATFAKFRIVVIEFHDLSVLIENPLSFNWLKATFGKLLRQFEVVHIHPNNWKAPEVVSGYAIPPLMEFTLLRKDLISRRSPAAEFPHSLDRANVPIHKDFVLPSCWFNN